MWRYCVVRFERYEAGCARKPPKTITAFPLFALPLFELLDRGMSQTSESCTFPSILISCTSMSVSQATLDKFSCLYITIFSCCPSDVCQTAVKIFLCFFLSIVWGCPSNTHVAPMSFPLISFY